MYASSNIVMGKEVTWFRNVPDSKMKQRLAGCGSWQKRLEQLKQSLPFTDLCFSQPLFRSLCLLFVIEYSASAQFVYSASTQCECYSMLHPGIHRTTRVWSNSGHGCLKLVRQWCWAEIRGNYISTDLGWVKLAGPLSNVTYIKQVKWSCDLSV